ncbi:hypothetical protein [Siphonobacter sp. SORGH_AS_1065]|uniref:hypothetical protein n=1 Tax=Siphonobacter sp. SORGH_AS_1065 TaxID=3041795 RepID=UPI0027866EDE|nr:hypothetical protein [Siphonobacter sp. SORGH_AS_1065]MDQ1086589.1 hypothetical protein [Siphonobacter sp. SORGH_AS_1065]
MTLTDNFTTPLAEFYYPNHTQFIPQGLREAALALLKEWNLELEDFASSFPGHSISQSQRLQPELLARSVVFITDPSLPTSLPQSKATELVIESPELDYDLLATRLNPTDQKIYFSGSVDYLALADTLQRHFSTALEGGFGSKLNPDLPGFEEGLLRKTSFSTSFKPFRLISPISPVEENIVRRLSHVLHTLQRWLRSLTDQGHSAETLLTKVEVCLELTGQNLLDAVMIRTLRFLLHHFQLVQSIQPPVPVFIYAYSHQSTADWVLSAFDSYAFTEKNAEVLTADVPSIDLLDLVSWSLAQQVWNLFVSEQ